MAHPTHPPRTYTLSVPCRHSEAPCKPFLDQNGGPSVPWCWALAPENTALLVFEHREAVSPTFLSLARPPAAPPCCIPPSHHLPLPLFKRTSGTPLGQAVGGRFLLVSYVIFFPQVKLKIQMKGGGGRQEKKLIKHNQPLQNEGFSGSAVQSLCSFFRGCGKGS